MKLETISIALNELDDRFISETVEFRPGRVKEKPERILHMSMKKRFISTALAAALVLALGITGYAAWNIHSARQQEIKSDLMINENNVTSYTEYAVSEEGGNGAILLSSVNDGEAVRVYANIYPVTSAEIEGFPGETSFSWKIEGTDIRGFAAPELPASLSLSGRDQIREAVYQYSYDEQSETLTVLCTVDLNSIERAKALLSTENTPLLIELASADRVVSKTFGPVSVEDAQEQRRSFDFNHALYIDGESGKSIELLGLELTPFSAAWSIHYEGDAALHSAGAEWNEEAMLYSALEDKVGIESLLYFSDGTTFSTGGALRAPYEDGAVKLICGWGKAVNIGDIQKITLGELVLWESNAE